MNIDKNYEFLSKIFLELLSNEPEFKPLFQAFAPEMYADIESAATNPNCSCRGRVENYVNNNREKCANFINELSENIKSKINLDQINSTYSFVNYSGTVKRTKISDWKKFFEQTITDRAAYRNFSVVRVDDETVDVFFL
jgi:hypothetical protein